MDSIETWKNSDTYGPCLYCGLPNAYTLMRLHWLTRFHPLHYLHYLLLIHLFLLMFLLSLLSSSFSFYSSSSVCVCSANVTEYNALYHNNVYSRRHSWYNRAQRLQVNSTSNVIQEEGREWGEWGGRDGGEGRVATAPLTPYESDWFEIHQTGQLDIQYIFV